MLSTQTTQTVHHGWTIRINQLEGEPLEVGSYYFECYPPNFPDYSNDGGLYGSAAAAAEAACGFIDREIAIQSLITVANAWLAAGLVSEAEYWNLTDFA